MHAHKQSDVWHIAHALLPMKFLVIFSLVHVMRKVSNPIGNSRTKEPKDSEAALPSSWFVRGVRPTASLKVIPLDICKRYWPHQQWHLAYLTGSINALQMH